MILTLSTYGRCFKYNIQTNEMIVLSHNAIHYSALKDFSNNTLVIYRPNYDVNDQNFLRRIGNKGTLTDFKIESKHTHEMILNAENNELLYISTFDGILYNKDLKTLKTKCFYNLGTRKQHINSLAIKENKLYTIFHNRGKSDISIFDMKNDYVLLKKYINIGTKCHSIVFYKDGFLYLNSEESKLCYYDEKHNKIKTIFTFYESCKYFLKGLLVIKCFAIVGLNHWGDSNFRKNTNSSLAIISLTTNELITIKYIQTNGIINSISCLDRINDVFLSQLNEYTTHNNIQSKLIRNKETSEITISYLCKVNITKLQDLIDVKLWDNIKYPFQNHFQSRLRNDKSMILKFCDSKCSMFYETPYWYKYMNILLPLLKQIFGNDVENHIARLQFALLRRGQQVLRHVDNNSWSVNYSRIHICLKTNTNVHCCFYKSNGEVIKHHIPEGHVIEFNNKKFHSVKNNGSTDRVHIILDYSKSPISKYLKIDFDNPIKYV